MKRKNAQDELECSHFKTEKPTSHFVFFFYSPVSTSCIYTCTVEGLHPSMMFLPKRKCTLERHSKFALKLVQGWSCQRFFSRDLPQLVYARTSPKRRMIKTTFRLMQKCDGFHFGVKCGNDKRNYKKMGAPCNDIIRKRLGYCNVKFACPSNAK